MKERDQAAYRAVAEEVAKLASLVQDSQEHQQAFLNEAYRLLQAQARDVEDLRNRAVSTEVIIAKIDEIGKYLAGLSKYVTVNVKKIEQTETGTDVQSFKVTSEEVPGAQGVPITPGMLPESQIVPGTPGMQPGSPTVPGTPNLMPGSPSIHGTHDQMPDVEAVPASEGMDQEAIPVLKPAHPPTHEPHANVRFLHASPDAPHVDIYVDGKRVATDLAFQGVTPYLPIPPGRRRIQVFPARKSAGALVDTVAQLQPGGHYTVAVAGFLRNIRSVVIEDHQKGARPGFARAKIVHLSPNGPAVDVTLPNGKVLIGHLIFKQKSPYFQVSPGTRELQLRVAGKPDIALRVPPIRFDPNLTYTLYIVGPSDHLGTMLLPEA